MTLNYVIAKLILSLCKESVDLHHEGVETIPIIVQNGIKATNIRNVNVSLLEEKFQLIIVILFPVLLLGVVEGMHLHSSRVVS